MKLDDRPEYRNGREIFRVVVSSAFEEQRTSALRQRLLALAN